jgi:hypothetical protein
MSTHTRTSDELLTAIRTELEKARVISVTRIGSWSAWKDRKTGAVYWRKVYKGVAFFVSASVSDSSDYGNGRVSDEMTKPQGICRCSTDGTLKDIQKFGLTTSDVSDVTLDCMEVVHKHLGLERNPFVHQVSASSFFGEKTIRVQLCKESGNVRIEYPDAVVVMIEGLKDIGNTKLGYVVTNAEDVAKYIAAYTVERWTSDELLTWSLMDTVLNSTTCDPQLVRAICQVEPFGSSKFISGARARGKYIVQLVYNMRSKSEIGSLQDLKNAEAMYSKAYPCVANYAKQGDKLLMTGVVPGVILVVIATSMCGCLVFFLVRRKHADAESLIQAICAMFTLVTSIAVVVLHNLFHPNWPILEALALRRKADDVSWLHRKDRYSEMVGLLRRLHSFGLKEQDYFSDFGTSFMEGVKTGRTRFQNGVSIEVLNSLGYKVCITQAGTIALLNPDKTTCRYLEMDDTAKVLRCSALVNCAYWETTHLTGKAVVGACRESTAP